MNQHECGVTLSGGSAPGHVVHPHNLQEMSRLIIERIVIAIRDFRDHATGEAADDEH